MTQPARIGAYVLVRELGRGGMGTVHLGQHSFMDRRAAVKVPHEALRQDRVALDRLGREAREADGLQHPHIARVYDVDLEHDPPYLALEYVEGESLAERLAVRRTLPVEEVVELLRPVAAALDHCHAHGRVHRDVKPSNVLLGSKDGRDWPVLSDFGLVRPEGAAALTETGVLMGTWDYLSPEQAAGRPAGPASDLYALGCVAFQCLTGLVPFRGQAVEVLRAHREDAPPRAAAYSPSLPAAVDDVLARVLDKDPERRRQQLGSATAFVEALGQAAEGTDRRTVLLPAPATSRPPAHEPAPPDEHPRRPRPARSAGPLVAAAAVALLGGVGAYLAADALVDRTPPPQELAFTDPVDAVLAEGAVLSTAQRELLARGPLDRLLDCAGQPPQNTRVVAAVGCTSTYPGVDGLLLRQAAPGALADVLDSDSRPAGDCAREVGVDGRWAGGPLACYDNNAGVAALQWGYADSGIFLVGVRNDGDNAALWAWWSSADWSTPAGPEE